jgi:hypothetical protein
MTLVERVKTVIISKAELVHLPMDSSCSVKGKKKNEEINPRF